MKKTLQIIHSGKSLSEAEMTKAMKIIMSGEASKSETAAFLMGLSMRGETIDEITGAAKVMRKKAQTIKAPKGAVDCCGTGGDVSGTYNISTAVAFVAAACGIPMAKHGNRAASSKSGAADVLEALGVKLNVAQKVLEQSLTDLNFAFLLAPNHHESVKHVVPVRKALGIPTIFNILGPIANPAETKHQLIGVFDHKWVMPMAETLKNLGTKSAWVVHGEDGLDEITTTDNTYVAMLDAEGNIKQKTLEPKDFGLETSKPKDLKGGSAETNAKALLAIFEGEKNAYRDIVLANTAAVLVIHGKTEDLKEAVSIAAEAIDSGNALQVLKDYIDITNGNANKSIPAEKAQAGIPEETPKEKPTPPPAQNADIDFDAKFDADFDAGFDIESDEKPVKKPKKKKNKKEAPKKEKKQKSPEPKETKPKKPEVQKPENEELLKPPAPPKSLPPVAKPAPAKPKKSSGNTLLDICDVKREHIQQQLAKKSLEDIKLEAVEAPPARKFVETLMFSSPPSIIAEVKKASPSKGIIRDDFDPAAIAKAYESGGATCISVLTDEPYFQGKDEDLKSVKAAVSLPVLRKDFIIDPYQVYESRALGADCILLIMAALDDLMASKLFNLATELRMDVLVEVHDEEELERAVKFEPYMIGVNSRDLKTLKVDLETAKSLLPKIPQRMLRIAESGIDSAEKLKKLQAVGYQGFLIGEHLMRENDIEKAIRTLLA